MPTPKLSALQIDPLVKFPDARVYSSLIMLIVKDLCKKLNSMPKERHQRRKKQTAKRKHAMETE